MIENNDQQEKWDKALLGESITDTENPVERKAHTVRQLILWEAAQEAKDLIPTHQAIRFHKQVVRVNRRRKWLRGGIIGVLSIAIMALAYILMQKQPDQHNEQKATIDPKNFETKSTILDMPYMLAIPEGTFTMGCTPRWDDIIGDCHHSEKPPHDVNIKKFALSKYETTVAQFKKFVEETNYLTTAEKDKTGCTVEGSIIGKGSGWTLSEEHNWRNPGFKQDNDQHPVVCISWIDTQAYIEWIRKKTGIDYRLPTEEEWEYAARAGGITMYHWGPANDHDFANSQGVGGKDKWKHTSPVGKFSANDWGIQDMSGNVWEWTSNCWTPDYKNEDECPNPDIKMRRGGSWFDTYRSTRSATRGGKRGSDALARSFLYGFRVAHD